MSQCHDTYGIQGVADDVLGTVARLPVRVRDLMTVKPITVEPTATIKEIAQVLLDHDIRSVPVVDIGDQLVGMVGEADLVCREGFPSVRSHSLAGLVESVLAEHQHHWTQRTQGLTAGEIMTTDVVTCEPHEIVSGVARRMVLRAVRSVPVVEGGRLVGILSRHDILRLFNRPDPEIRRNVAAYLANPLWAPESHMIEPAVRDGVVVLSGSVCFPNDRRLVVSILGQIPGVIGVVDHLTVKDPEPRPAYVRDTDWRA
jgi:CBS domain-containing protein